MKIRIDQIRRDGGTQMRTQIDEPTVLDYAERIKAGDAFPPVVAFYDGSHYWLADGFHRARATAATGAEEIECDVRSGSRLDAVKHAVGANISNGLRRTNLDKAMAVRAALAHPDLMNMGSVSIASFVGVSHTMVDKYRQPATVAGSPQVSKIYTDSDRKAMAAHPPVVAPRIGRDGKERRPPRNEAPTSKPAATVAKGRKPSPKAEEIDSDPCPHCGTRRGEKRK